MFRGSIPGYAPKVVEKINRATGEVEKHTIQVPVKIQKSKDFEVQIIGVGRTMQVRGVTSAAEATRIAIARFREERGLSNSVTVHCTVEEVKHKVGESR